MEYTEPIQVLFSKSDVELLKKISEFKSIGVSTFIRVSSLESAREELKKIPIERFEHLRKLKQSGFTFSELLSKGYSQSELNEIFNQNE